MFLKYLCSTSSPAHLFATRGRQKRGSFKNCAGDKVVCVFTRAAILDKII